MRASAFLSVPLLALFCATHTPAADDKEDRGVRLEGATREGGRSVRLGGISVGASYSRGGYPWWGPYGSGWYGPGWYGPGWSPWLWGPGRWGWYDPWMYSAYPWYGPVMTSPAAGMGEVKLTTETKTASVYLDGAYAGTAGELKSMWLRPGAYSLELRDDRSGKFEKRIYVLSGKTLRLKPEFARTEEVQP